MSSWRDSAAKIYKVETGSQFLENVAELKPGFVLVVAYSGTVQLEGLSAAGITTELREYTAAADAEIMEHGRALCLKSGVPSHPSGIPGPSIITRAAFNLIPDMPYLCVDAGLKVTPQMKNFFRLEGAAPGAAINSGQTLAVGQATRLFNSGYALGEKLGKQYRRNGNYMILAESVPGGTTTALGLLLALGVDAEDRVSSSMPGNAHGPKLAAVMAGLEKRGATKGSFKANPLEGAEASGDPMQPAAAGILLGASQYCPVMLGGGTQMAAVLALAMALGEPGTAALATTRWVSADPTADLKGLAAEIDQKFGPYNIPYLASNLSFKDSRHPMMQKYEEGYVKEGVGAGAAAIAACLYLKCTAQAILPDVEGVYETLVLGLPKS